MSIGAYLLIVRYTGKFYVGSTRDLKTRLERHFRELRANTHGNKNLQELWNAGKGIVVITYPFETREEAYEFEQLVITNNLENPKMLNIGMGVKGGDNLSRNPDRLEIIDRMKASVNARMSSIPEDVRKLIWGKPGALNWMFGKTHSPEVKKKLSDMHKGNTYALGCKRSEENKRAISERAKLRKGEKNPFFGKSHSDETKKLISETKKGTFPPNEKAVMIDGVTYRSVTEAGRQLGIPTVTVLHRVKSQNPKFATYCYLT